ncbi:ATP-binding protein [Pokkaliibacter sp. MBI-7]|uniref:ATP-binding protein n=1 Tax=Pokkaliibacter sp. MBI-7 TaxID=3040600 RepID=UPI002448B772|nr:ATP-binding protein [Pokkaliibacter sp. MBI-7]MDH2432304.1 ATP-binding protein [Pokkaliibacter sp. MBI-7]
MQLTPSHHSLRNPVPWLIGGLLLLLGIALIAITALWSYRSTLESLEAQGENMMDRFSTGLERELSKYEYLPELLSTHPELIRLAQHPDDASLQLRINQQLHRSNAVAGASVMYLMSTDGQTIASSNWQDDDSFVGKNFNYRPYFTQAMQGQTGRYFALGTTSNIRGYFFAYPLRANDRIIGVLVVKVAVNRLESLWKNDHSTTIVTDKDGVIFISTRANWQLKTLTPLTPAAQQRIVESQRYGPRELTSLSIVEKRQLSASSSLVTILDSAGNGRPQSSMAEDIHTVAYLQQQRPIPNYDFTLRTFTRLSSLYSQVLNHVVLVTTLYVILVMIGVFIRLRRRIRSEREAFHHQSSQNRALNKARIQAIIDNTHAGLVTLDTDGRIESFNPMAEALFGYDWQHIKGHFISELFAEANRSQCWQRIETLKQTPHDAPAAELLLEARGLRADRSEFPIEWVIGDMHLQDERKFLITIHDITERKRYEQALHHARDELEQRVEERTTDLSLTNARLLQEINEHRQTQNELIQTAKLALLGQMSASINHELNQPLAAIRSFSENARHFVERQEYERAHNNLATIIQLTERMARMIAQFKVFARKSSGQPEPLQWKTVLDGALAMLHNQLEKYHTTINIEPASPYAWVQGDMLQLEQVLINILTNALQAMHESSHTAAAPSRANRIDIYLDTSTPDRVTLCVRDHGPGIPDTHLPRVFEPFFTSKPIGQGLGIGLSISHRIVDNLHGELSAENHPEGGALFRISLPAAHPVQRTSPMIG